MEPEQLKELIEAAVKSSIREGEDVMSKKDLHELMHDAVIEAMSTLGIDARNPMDVQRDMQFVRELRLMSEKVKQKTYLTIVALVVGSMIAALWMGIKSAIVA